MKIAPLLFFGHIVVTLASIHFRVHAMMDTDTELDVPLVKTVGIDWNGIRPRKGEHGRRQSKVSRSPTMIEAEISFKNHQTRAAGEGSHID